MSGRERTLLGLLVFNAISAVGGGLALMVGWIPEQASWVRETDFESNYFPGVILLAVVGGSSLIAAVAMLKGAAGWPLAAIVAGTVMVFWIIGEVASIRAFHVLQVLYLVTGASVVAWTPSGPGLAPPRPPRPPDLAPWEGDVGGRPVRTAGRPRAAGRGAVRRRART